MSEFAPKLEDEKRFCYVIFDLARLFVDAGLLMLYSFELNLSIEPFEGILFEHIN
jgi:hypothetical protein